MYERELKGGWKASGERESWKEAGKRLEEGRECRFPWDESWRLARRRELSWKKVVWLQEHWNERVEGWR